MKELNKEYIVAKYQYYNDEFLINKYGIASNPAYLKIKSIDDGINQYLKTEDDIKVKFGGFLELELLKDFNGNYTVHSELRAYNYNHSFIADLSIHNVDYNYLWDNPEKMLGSLQCIIEIKYCNFNKPEYGMNLIYHDIDKLNTLEPNVLRFLMIIDEYNGLKDEYIAEILNRTKDKNITILSKSQDAFKMGLRYCNTRVGFVII
ncbi:MAG: hypothetical protein WC644_01125 [Ignavibacteria bacterium]